VTRAQKPRPFSIDRAAREAARDLLTGALRTFPSRSLTMRASSSLGLAIFSFAAMNAGCGGSNGPDTGGYDDLFSAPNGAATPDRLQGLWGGGAEQGGVAFDVRFRVADAQTTVALRCNFDDGTQLLVGAEAASRITEKPKGDTSCFPLTPGGDPTECGDVEFLESKSDRRQSGEKWCSVDIHPQAYEWTMSGLKLRFTLNGQDVDLVKVSD
jgi:hypothetical protein